ncbi:MAG TPA: TonB-dependent receptor plug domain-containing protein, partial [Chitinophagaceae bacterium]|nr:TonB-dependent receptor plug domain-containing protein [Chitinophagaceae bacterium]
YIEKRNTGQDLPFILSQTPSAVASSDAGTGIGYTGLRIRGTDLTRINVTLNGIPYNDPESQGVFFVDLPDFASSLSSVQIQRGVGTSSNGAGAFGATINLSTNELRAKPYASLFNSIGSYGSRRHTVTAGTGLIDNRFTVDARLSHISSDGFIDRAAASLQSFYLSGAWIGARSSVRLNVLSGREKTYQAWNGIPEHKLFFNRDSLTAHYYNNLGSLYFTREDSVNLFDAPSRKYNGFLYPNQTDNYRQDHYQLFFNHRFSGPLTLSTALFLTPGEGYYEEFKYSQRYSAYGLPPFSSGGTSISRTDLVRQLWLQNDFYGGVFSLQHRSGARELTAGGSATRFSGHHFGKITWAQQGVNKDHEWYRYPALKDDANLYVKGSFPVAEHWSLMGDLQYRYVRHRLDGSRKVPELDVNARYHFVNPKAGLFYRRDGFSGYLSYARAQKEPNRNDFEAAFGGALPAHEELHDFEAGVEQAGKNLRYGATIYYMRYKNQLVLTGKLSDTGDPIRINVPKSYRLGLEAWAGTALTDWLFLEANATISRNRLQQYTDYIPRYDTEFEFAGYDTLRLPRSEISFSPWLTAFGAVRVLPFKGTELTLNNKAVSKQYLDNTESKSRRLNGYFVQDLVGRYTLPLKKDVSVELVLQVSNLWNRKYESNGYTYSYFYDTTLVKENFYYPMAGRNYMAGLNIKL